MKNYSNIPPNSKSQTKKGGNINDISNIPPKSKMQTNKGGNMKNKSNIPPNSKKRTKKIIKDHKKEQDLKGDFYALRPRRKMKNHKIKFNQKKFDFKGKAISLDAYPDLKPGMQMDQIIVLLSNSSPGTFVILTMFLRSIPMSCKLVLYLYEIKFLGQEIENFWEFFCNKNFLIMNLVLTSFFNRKLSKEEIDKILEEYYNFYEENSRYFSNMEEYSENSEIEEKLVI
ncbi:MAG TPA: hypothetical protein PK993_03625 [Clostridia bacterium]|nr:hypothetical protein [Clostridia bacterium]